MICIFVANNISYMNNKIYNNYLSLFQLRGQKEKIAACSRDIRRKLRHTNSQLNLLVDERADLTSKVIFYN